MLLIDRLEKKKTNTPVQPYGPEASTFTEELLTGKTVKLELDFSERDQYGRLLAYAYIDDQMVNECCWRKGTRELLSFSQM